MRDLRDWISLFIDLIRLKLSVFVTLSAAMGFFLAPHGVSLKMGLMLAGVFFLASGASSLNQYQERRQDLLMERTKFRPIPSGRLSPSTALKISFLLFIPGFCLLYGFTTGEAFGLGLLAVLLYNGLYTPLKKKTLFAVLPGTLVGAFPPAIGWFSGGGKVEARLLALFAFFFFWQVPHFWLLLLDFRKDYQQAGFLSPVQALGLHQVEKISFIWILATVVSGLLIPLFGIGNSFILLVGLPILGLWLIVRVLKNFSGQHKANSYRIAFRTVNFYMISVMALFSLDQLMHSP